MQRIYDTAQSVRFTPLAQQQHGKPYGGFRVLAVCAAEGTGVLSDDEITHPQQLFLDRGIGWVSGAMVEPFLSVVA